MAHHFRQGPCLVSCPAIVLFPKLTCLIAAALICSNVTQMSTVKKLSLTTDHFKSFLLLQQPIALLYFNRNTFLYYPALAGTP